MNKFFITVIIIAIIGGAFLFYKKSSIPVVSENNPKINSLPIETAPKTETSATNNTAKKVTVDYTNNGFSPKTVTIKNGDTVVFVNQSSESLWVASDPHPVHTNFSAFDEKTAITKGNSWSFTFNKIGTWGYHNHKNPSNIGTIIVK